MLCVRTERRGVESLVEASAAEAEAISAALAKASREQNGEQNLDRDRGSEATPSGKPPQASSAALMALNRASMANTIIHTPPTGVRLHHRAVSCINWVYRGCCVCIFSVFFHNGVLNLLFVSIQSVTHGWTIIWLHLSTVLGCEKKILATLIGFRHSVYSQEGHNLFFLPF